MAGTAADIQTITLSPATLWQAPLAEPLPDETTVAFGADWGGNWTPFGFTNGALTFAYEFDNAEADIEQSLAMVKRKKTNERSFMEARLAEFCLAVLTNIWEGTVTTTAPGVGQVGFEEWNVGNDNNLTERAYGAEGSWVDSSGNRFPIRVFFYKATSAQGAQLQFSKNEFIGIPFRIDALGDLSQSFGNQLVKIQRVTAVATS